MSDLGEVRLACRCYAVRREDGPGWLVTGAAFLCPDSHRSGDTVTPEDESRRRMVEVEAARGEAEMLEQDGLFP